MVGGGRSDGGGSEVGGVGDGSSGGGVGPLLVVVAVVKVLVAAVVMVLMLLSDDILGDWLWSIINCLRVFCPMKSSISGINQWWCRPLRVPEKIVRPPDFSINAGFQYL